ncbi:upstream activation factor subunit UAF30-like [Gossypium australe]|uniref:Upstream activation factor subunit UAF30-like n=1 Tax=Gossypium australe TaxID=47621 RepID=A0A5B6VHF3_9ROSI|nr:upstream activation factor subunit UAF30-like [Gossypium australe]
MFRLYKGFKELLASSATAAVPSTAAKFYAAAAAKTASPKVAQKTRKKPTTSKPKTKKPAALRSETRPTGISKVTPVSPALGQFLGAQQASRTEAVKQIWSYIKSQNLQNPNNRKEIFCDEKLKTIFNGKEKVGFLEIGKMLTPHFVKTT